MTINTKKIAYIIVFLVFEAILVLLLYINAQSKKEQIFSASKTLVSTQFNTVYNSFDTLAYSVFRGYINKDDVIEAFAKKDREKLYELLKKDYEYLRAIDFEQIHFHTSSNHSFLRMHKPERFGDDLTNIRYSVKYVNEFKKPIMGLEMGRIVPGFRYVYPMFDKENRHIGSIETSFNVKSFSNKIESTYDVHTHFILHEKIFNEKIFDSYRQYYSKSIESDEYIFLNRNSTEVIGKEEKYIKRFFDTTLKEQIKDKLKEYKTFSLELDITSKQQVHKHKIITFLPLQNIEKQNIGYYVVYQDSRELAKLEKEFYNSIIIFSLFNILVVFLMYKSFINKEFLKQAIKDKTRKINQKNRELKKLNNSLEETIQVEVEKIKEQEVKLFEAEKMAQMGEMISNIAHQWRQPLNTISICASGVKLSYELETNSAENSIYYMNTILDNTQFLSKTIDVFRDFIKERREYKEISVQECTSRVLTIFKEAFKSLGITVQTNLEVQEAIKIQTISKDLAQVLVNILNNAKDVLKEREIQNPWISIEVYKRENERVVVLVEDNAGGVSEDKIKKIFEPYFTTKHQSIGTGLGLYISKKIVNESLKGKISVNNTNKGAQFIIELPLMIEGTPLV